ncbi:MAG: IPT/TIG domain-containing protein [Acidobacteria bacterium]|nr:IPT/TIG domain-containing protein [Acidobacteriota bacterium]
MRRSVPLSLILGALGWAAAGRAQTLPAAAFGVTPASLSFTYQIGTATLPAAQTVQVKSSASAAALDFTVTSPPSAPWLIVTPAAGKTGTAIGVRVNPTSLLAGAYAAELRVNAAGVPDPALVSVVLVIKNPPPTMAAAPGALTFQYTTDQSAPPAAQTVAVSTDGEPLSFTAAVSGAAWLSVTPALGIAVSGSPVALTVSVATEGALPGAYSGKITLTSTNAANKSIALTVALNVAPGRAVVTALWPSAAPAGAGDQTVTLRGAHLFKTSVVRGGTATLATTWISTGVLLAVIPKASLAAQGVLEIVVTNAPQAGSSPLVFQVTAPGPIVQSVVNAASFAGGGARPQLAPGEIVSIFGSGLGPAVLVQAVPAAGAFPASVGAPPTIVEFELGPGVWTPAPIIFAQANQINAVAPFAMTPSRTMNLRVTCNSIVSAPLAFDSVAAHPGLFTIDSSGRGQAAALNYDAVKNVYSLNSASNPVPKGGTIVLFGTGGGVTNPLPSPEGQIVPLSSPVPTVAGAVSLTIGGDGATLQSATAVPGSIAGLMQLNVTVPASIKAGKDLPVVLGIGGQASPAHATIAVK